MSSVASSRCILDLSWSFEKVCDLGGPWNLFLCDHDLVFIVAELTHPDLISIDFLEHARLIEDSLAAWAYFGISCGELPLVSENVEGDLEDISVEFLSVYSSVLLPSCGTFIRLVASPHAASSRTIFLVTQVQITAKVI